MCARFLVPAFLAIGVNAWTAAEAVRDAPSYSVTSVVNAADNRPAWLAPNTLATIYGTGLAYSTRALGQGDVAGGVLPTVLPGTGVRVLVGGFLASLLYVSPRQINFLVPGMLLPGSTDVQVVVDGLAGPALPVQLADSAPALFQLDAQTAVAARADGAAITPDAPAKPGDWVILYATGLGQTSPPVVYLQLPVAPAALSRVGGLHVTLAGVPVEAERVAYAGVAPGFAGLYQINVKLPDGTGADPEIRLTMDDRASVAGLRLPVRP